MGGQGGNTVRLSEWHSVRPLSFCKGGTGRFALDRAVDALLRMVHRQLIKFAEALA